ncbi:uncharacterized protein LOC121961710 [Plectropomus leopardus]|uniref:uncharacterized protein LOC121961710 n=1 Tax=Plectropomus leopardus TaxID=160734 RepID=UPI001C4D78B9|nr:uncharacterized protein LOC121961710 [Plectropomus leopardus]
MKAIAAFLLVLCHLAISHAWECDEAPQLSGAQQIDAGLGKVVALAHNRTYLLVRTYWTYMSTTRFKHVSVGRTGVWACDSSNKVYKYIAGNFVRSTGLSMQQVDAGGDGQLVGISTTSSSYCVMSRTASLYSTPTSLTWRSLSRSLRYISCSPKNECWGVDRSHRVYFMRVNPTTCRASNWRQVTGQQMIMVEVGDDGSVFGINTRGQVYQRVGISYGSASSGSRWNFIPMCMKIRSLSYDLRTLWVVTKAGFILKCLQTPKHRDDMKAIAAFLLVLCHLAVSHAWSCDEGPQLYDAQQIDAGLGKVVVLARNISYCLIGSSWTPLSSIQFGHVSVGPAGIWASDTSNRVYKYIQGKFEQSSGLSMFQVDAGGSGQLVGADTASRPYCLTSSSVSLYSGSSSLSWTSLGGILRYISCSQKNGCWGISPTFSVFHTSNVDPTNCRNSGWRQVRGLNLKMIEVGNDGAVFGLGTDGRVYQRTGITYGRATSGRGWANIPMCMKIRSLSYNLGTLWVVTYSGLVLKCKR